MPSTQPNQERRGAVPTPGGAAAAARLLADAGATGRRIADLPAPLRPTTAAQAYAIQDETMRLHGPAGGWKVAPPKDGGEPRCAPILASRIAESPAVLPAVGLCEPELEVEIALRLGRDLPRRSAPYSQAELADAIASVHPAFEVLSSRYQDRKAVSALSTLADCQSNGAAVIGQPLSDWHEIEFGAISIGLFCDGRTIGATEGGATSESVLAAVAWLANHAAERCGGLRRGQVVLTGARIGPVRVSPQTLIDADFLDLGRVSLAIAAAG